MTPADLIAQWFAKHQENVASNIRFVTLAQIDLLRKLAEEEDEFLQQSGEPCALQPGSGRSFVWMPKGCDKFIITEGRDSRRNTITRLSNVQASGAGRLFDC